MRVGQGMGADAGARAPQDGATPLFIAAEKGRLAVARILLDAGANTEAKDKVRARIVFSFAPGVRSDGGWWMPPNQWTGLGGRSPIVVLKRAWLDQGFSTMGVVNQMGEGRGVGADAGGSLGHTPLHTAAHVGQFGVAVMLLAVGANTEAKETVRQRRVGWGEGGLTHVLSFVSGGAC